MNRLITLLSSGTELADEILSIRPEPRVLWMSGFVDEDIIRIKMFDGFAGFLSKPLRRAGLLQAVERVIEGQSGGLPGRGHPEWIGDGRNAPNPYLRIVAQPN